VSVPFAITAATNLVRLDTGNRGRTAFTVSNRTASSLPARAVPTPALPAEAGWLAVEGEPEREIAAGATEQYGVLIAVAPGTPTGIHSFRLDVASAGQALTEGPSVSYQVMTLVPVPRRAHRGYLATLAGAALGGLVGAALGLIPGAVLSILALTRGGPQRLLAPALAGGAILGAGLGAFGGAWLNLRLQGYDGARETALILGGAYLATVLVLGLVLALVVRFAHADAGSLGFVLGLVAVLVPPVPARALYLAIAARRLGGGKG
jgi:hypothetical protein